MWIASRGGAAAVVCSKTALAQVLLILFYNVCVIHDRYFHFLSPATSPCRKLAAFAASLAPIPHHSLPSGTEPPPRPLWGIPHPALGHTCPKFVGLMLLQGETQDTDVTKMSCSVSQVPPLCCCSMHSGYTILDRNQELAP